LTKTPHDIAAALLEAFLRFQSPPQGRHQPPRVQQQVQRVVDVGDDDFGRVERLL
jgi:hypothetical protein